MKKALAAGICVFVLGSMQSWAIAPLEVVGLFKNRAVIRAPGGEMIVKVGETTNGVTLLSADSSSARVRYQGKEYQLSLSGRVGASFHAPQKTEVTINPDQIGQYRTRGAINNQGVSFLVDTGASVVALSSHQARGLGIPYERGQKGIVQTAQGQTNSHFVILDEVTVGTITAYNVQAAVIDGNYPLDILLGMSFLRQVGMRENDGVLTLTQKY